MNEHFRRLAVLYFEGRITPDEECELFGFIAAEPQNAVRLREWEREWKRQHVPSDDVRRSLARFNAKIGRRRTRMRLRRWLGFSAAAAVLVLLSVLALRRTEAVEAPEQIFTVEAPQGTRSRITLYDGTQIWLNAGSTLSYTSGFNETARDIRLSGEAYFEVARNEELPFRVEARGCRLTVLGTKFNVSAYDDDPTLQAALVEGSLHFESSLKGETMAPGDLITYHCATGQARREQTDPKQFCGWINGIIRYDAITLPALLRKLSREHAEAIELCTSAFDCKTFRISLTEAQDIESILEGLCDILPIAVRRDRNGYHVYSRK